MVEIIRLLGSFFDLVNTKCTVIDIVAIKKCGAGGKAYIYRYAHLVYSNS